MSKLEKLIQQYCPDGVEYHPLWSLTAWDKKFNGIDKSKQKRVINANYLLAADLKSYQVDEGTVKLLTTNISNLYTSEELAGDLASEGEVVAIPSGGNPIVQYYKGRFLTADNRIATSLDTNNLNNKFLYYCMLSQMKLISSFYRGSGIKHPEMAKVLDLEIPVPPLPVQEEIVRVLDTFTELQAELQKRQQQYNFYRDNLLNFKNIDRGGQAEVRWMKLKDIGKVCMCKRILKSQTSSSGDVPFFKIGTFGGNADAYISQALFNEYKSKYSYPQKGDVLISAAGTIGRTIVFDGTPSYFQDSNIVWLKHDESIVLNSYLRYCYALNPWVVSTGGTIARLYNDNILEATIPVPSLANQQRIVSILDRFDTLTNDLTSGLPAEMEKRRQQYEFYRDKLLTFKRKEA